VIPRLHFYITRHLAGRTAEAIVGDANFGATRIASVFCWLGSLFAIVAHPPSPLLTGEEYFKMAKAKFNPSDDRFTRGIIRRKIKQIIGRVGFSKQDREDLEQDLLIRVLQSLPQFDPDVAHRNKFITTVVERYVANILRNKRADKRVHWGVTSLSVLIEISEEGTTELAQTIGERELDNRILRKRRSPEELAQLELDMKDVIATLPDSWQTLLELRKTRTMQEVAEEMDVPRSTLNHWIHRIRERFESSGMSEYLKD
jgi:RNA polymerase sigma-70 factor (ECF subfamily)